MAKSNLKFIESNYISQFPKNNLYSKHFETDFFQIYLILNKMMNIINYNYHLKYKFFNKIYKFNKKNFTFFKNIKINTHKNDTNCLFFESSVMVFNLKNSIFLFFFFDSISNKLYIEKNNFINNNIYIKLIFIIENNITKVLENSILKIILCI